MNGNMVDFSFIVSLYVSDLPNVTISTNENLATVRVRVRVGPKDDAGLKIQWYEYRTLLLQDLEEQKRTKSYYIKPRLTD